MITTFSTNVYTRRTITINQASDGQIFHSEEYGSDRVIKAARLPDGSCYAKFIDALGGELIAEVKEHLTIDSALYALCDLTSEFSDWESPQKLGY